MATRASWRGSSPCWIHPARPSRSSPLDGGAGGRRRGTREQRRVTTAVRPRLLFDSLRGYQRSWLPRDLVAGLTVWAVLVPESLAYATIAGVSPVVGLYAAPPALLLYAAFGSSKHLVTGPMAATAAVSAAAVADIAARSGVDITELTMGLALVTGVFGLLAGLA